MVINTAAPPLPLLAILPVLPSADSLKLQKAHAQLEALQKAMAEAEALLEKKKAKMQKAVELLVFEQHKADVAKHAAAAAKAPEGPAPKDYSCFYTKAGTAGFHQLSSILGDLHLPLLKAIQSADGLHKSMVFLPVNDLCEVLLFLDMLANLTSAASHSVAVTGNESLPPYPALGLAWMMHSLNRPYHTLSEIQALHQLATSAASPAMAKLLTDSAASKGFAAHPTGSLPVPLAATAVILPSGPGITPHNNVLIKLHLLVLLSQASIKDHPQKGRIIALAKTLFDSNSPKSHESCLGKDYL